MKRITILTITLMTFLLSGCTDEYYIIDNSGVNLSYGEIYYHDETTPLIVPITSINVYTQIINMTVGECNVMTCDTDSFTVNKDAMYSFDSTLSFTGGANSNYHCAVFKQGVELQDCEFQRTMGNTATIGVSTISCLIHGETGVSVNDLIDVRCQDTDAPAQVMSVYALNLNLVEVS